jgi:hypothetical protein
LLQAMAPNFNDVCLLSQCLRPINFTRKTPNHAIDQFVEGIRQISIQERSSGWLRDSFKNEFLEEETILLRALFATPFLNEDGFGDSFRHAWGKECIGFKTTITQDELTQYFPARDSPHLKPDETTQDLPFQERRHPSLNGYSSSQVCSKQSCSTGCPNQKAGDDTNGSRTTV